jgi:hypothetical protein
MAALSLSVAQVAAVKQMQQLTDGLTGGLATLADAIGQGVVDQDNNPLPIPMPGISEWASLTAAQQQQALNGLLQGFAALLVTLNIQPPPATTFSGTVPLAQLTPEGSPGLLTFVAGICTAAIQPS